jgi:hypothetical protein
MSLLTLKTASCALSIAVFAACGPRLSVSELSPQDIETTLFLVGDAGEQDPRRVGPALDSMSRQAAAAPERSIIVFLGDNVYPSGIPRDSSLTWDDAKRRLQNQVDAVPNGVRAIFVPGNHDWAGETAFGLESVRLEERMIRSMARGRNIRMLPGNGCPGPAALDTGRLRFIALDTQWWLHDFIVRDERSNCPTTTGAVTARLRALVHEKQERRVVIVGAHHPLMTGGQHGGYCGLAGVFRRLSGQNQDIMSTTNRAMRDSIEAAFTGEPPLVYAAGHDHNLQVMKGGPSAQYLIVSGAGSPDKAECAVYLRESYYVSQHRAGFMRIDILKGKGVLLSVFDYTSAGVPGRPFFTRWLEPR